MDANNHGDAATRNDAATHNDADPPELYLFRQECQKLLEAKLVWSFELPLECEKLEHCDDRQAYAQSLLAEMAKNGVPFILYRGKEKFDLAHGFCYTI